MNLIKIKYTVRYGFQIIKHIATVNPVAVTKVNVNNSHLLGQVIKFGIDRPIEFFSCKVVAQLRYHTQ